MTAILNTTTSSAATGTFLRFSGDSRNHHRQNLSFRTYATAEQQNLTSSLSLYELLGIAPSDGVEQVKKAYKRMARKYHPDVSPPERTELHTQRFIEVQTAYETLSDPQRRAEYDRRLRSAFGPRRFDQEMEMRSEWRNKWQDQISELKKRSNIKNNNINNISDENLSWGARMRMKRAAQASNE
ncbi:hypothetical protein LUZ60_004772 [Juncus effusus]|nr:hypothetical protein LUZ60_004772 [Juncus effusus]